MWNKIIHRTEPLLEYLPGGKQLVRKRRLQQRFRTELELIKGTHKNPNNHIQRHVRKGQPGDYRNKLKPETIDALNERFASILTMFGYDQK